MLLILGIILLIIAIAGGAIIHPIIFALAIVAIVLFFMHNRAAGPSDARGGLDAASAPSPPRTFAHLSSAT